MLCRLTYSFGSIISLCIYENMQIYGSLMVRQIYLISPYKNVLTTSNIRLHRSTSLALGTWPTFSDKLALENFGSFYLNQNSNFNIEALEAFKFSNISVDNYGSTTRTSADVKCLCLL